MLLNALKDKSITSLPGIGKAIASCYANMGIYNLYDLVTLSPRLYEDRTKTTTLRNVDENGQVFTQIKILSHSYFGKIKNKGQRTLKIQGVDISGQRISLLCFGRNFLEKSLPIGSSPYIYGTVSSFNNELQTSNFEVYTSREAAGVGKILPIYPLSGSLNQRIIRRDVTSILSQYNFDDDIPSHLLKKYNHLSTDEAIRTLHSPKNYDELERARKTLAFSELLQLEVQLKRELGVKTVSTKTPKPTLKEVNLINALPFELTQDQETVIEEIRKDLDSKGAMTRLLQGDVGSGKTLIAWLSSLRMIDKGYQVAFMAPTELLARQHAEVASELLSPLGIRIAFITSDVKGKGRKLLLEHLKKGEIDIAIGTHALFSKDVEFKKLKYVIIDEQHRFGVEQRNSLLQKGEMPHLLLMSATPIPRTLALTFFGSLSVSTIKTMPKGRLPIKTFKVGEAKRDVMYETIGVEFLRGHQAYFVYPRIDDEGNSDLKDVTNMYQFLKEKYKDIPSALIHSKLSEEEKIQILQDFRNKKILYLVATSVVEVGIDIPDATCMVIENAERFGLAALHQLRGRVGRSPLQSYCFLVYSSNLTEDAGQRLTVMRESTDGFYIAEQDLLIRGPGEVSGQKQSGYLRLKFASITQDLDLIENAKIEADIIIREDVGLIKAENYALREIVKNSESSKPI